MYDPVSSNLVILKKSEKIVLKTEMVKNFPIQGAKIDVIMISGQEFFSIYYNDKRIFHKDL